MMCLKSVRYSIKLNGKLLDDFLPSRGLQQGDPLSPFLFLFVADGLSAILKHEVNIGNITPVKICRRAPGISHILFAYDSLLLFEATQDQALKVKEILDMYASATGQSISLNKCSILFGHACPEAAQDVVRTVLEVTKAEFE